MRKMMMTAAFLVASVATANAGEMAGGAVMATEAGGNAILTDAEGMTLYTFDKDEAGVSNCYDACAENWPPLMADEGAAATGDFSLVARKDGSLQWAYKDAPLYLWVKDAKAGDMTGDGVKGVWHIAVK